MVTKWGGIRSERVGAHSMHGQCSEWVWGCYEGNFLSGGMLMLGMKGMVPLDMRGVSLVGKRFVGMDEDVLNG